jgi:predicted lipid-binding transport protein (Tim44 family)
MTTAATRLGGARSTGMQRGRVARPERPGPSGVPAIPVPPRHTAVAPGVAPARLAAAAPASRRWAGALTGVVAGLGLAAFEHRVGFEEAVATLFLIAGIALAVLAGLAMRGAMTRRKAAGAVAVPAHFDTGAFISHAKAQFLALQSAHDERDVQRLRETLTPAMVDAVQDDGLPRDGAPQATEVFGLEAQVVDVLQARDTAVVSVRFTGRVRGRPTEVPEDLDEVWHVTRRRRGGSGWMLAGIQQSARPA